MYDNEVNIVTPLKLNRSCHLWSEYKLSQRGCIEITLVGYYWWSAIGKGFSEFFLKKKKNRQKLPIVRPLWVDGSISFDLFSIYHSFQKFLQYYSKALPGRYLHILPFNNSCINIFPSKTLVIFSIHFE